MSETIFYCVGAVMLTIIVLAIIIILAVMDSQEFNEDEDL